MNENKKIQFVGTGPTNNRKEQLEKQNTRTLMQALHGCRKNCQECREEEAE
jgi:hypothetical protein